ncbi:MAG: 3-oxoacyl-ACP reductase [Flavobacteriales bacterium]|jgi:NAD(P)-dependent dehydrogenase (short-subunit alcohol dehydrogenase family)|nr:3-oxoacyl-ACP reductase [Flavobacteriales bacterium]|tara:strand:+ start:2944 stop:3699 length:756 start_codon:yes stop_codon:yes gene_type:complete
MDEYFHLKDKKILVTGASSGIGKGIAERLARAGAHLYICGRDKERLDRVAESLNGTSHQTFLGDLTSAELQEHIASECEKLDGVVLNAGLIELIPFQIHNDQSIRELMEVNYMAPTLLLQKLIKNRKIARNASMILMSSVTSAVHGSIGGTIYGSSKGALEGLVKSLSIELGKQGIRVNSVSPGIIQTEAIEVLRTSLGEESFQNDLKKYPLGRYGEPKDVASAVHFLLSDSSSWITGINLVVDGGLTAHS